MKIVLLNWKDIKHPLAGGAETLSHQIFKRLVKDGHDITMIVSKPKGQAQFDEIDGYKVVRMGNKLTLYPRAMFYYLKNLKSSADLVIDEINTIPFMAKFYAGKRNIVFIHQLAREIWFYEMPILISWIGFLLEPIYLWLLSNKKTITVSESSKKDLLKYGFKSENISIISEGTEIEPVKDLNIEKYKEPTLLILGSIRAMKRTMDGVKAFELAREKIQDLKLIIAGNPEGSYGEKVHEYVLNSKYKDDIQFLGKVTFDKKKELMQKSHILLVNSVKEGWGLVVTEANSQGTVAVVYDVDGLRDSVINNVTGIVTKVNVKSFAEGIVTLLGDTQLYGTLRANAYEKSKEITFEKAYEDFKFAANIK